MNDKGHTYAKGVSIFAIAFFGMGILGHLVDAGHAVGITVNLAERDKIIATRKLEDIAEQSVSHPLRWPYFERTNGGTDDNPPHK